MKVTRWPVAERARIISIIRNGTRILIEEGQPVIDHENATARSRIHVAGVDVPVRARRRRGRMDNEALAPAPTEFRLIDDLIRLDHRFQACSRCQPLVMNDPGVRLINDLVPGMANLECEIGVLVITRA